MPLLQAITISAALPDGGSSLHSTENLHVCGMQDCSLVIYGAAYLAGGSPVSANALFGTPTAGKGVGLCSVVVSGANGGTVSIIDSQGNTLFTEPPSASG